MEISRKDEWVLAQPLHDRFSLGGAFDLVVVETIGKVPIQVNVVGIISSLDASKRAYMSFGITIRVKSRKYVYTRVVDKIRNVFVDTVIRKKIIYQVE